MIIQASFFWLSDGEVPIDVRRPYAIDRKLFVGETGAEILDYALLGVFLAYCFSFLCSSG